MPTVMMQDLVKFGTQLLMKKGLPEETRSGEIIPFEVDWSRMPGRTTARCSARILAYFS